MTANRSAAVDPRERPRYPIEAAARYLGLPRATVQYWVTGRTPHAPLVETPAQRPAALSFVNLVELHVLAAIRRRHAVSAPRLRAALAPLHARAGEPGERRPLAGARLEGDGLEPFVERYGTLANIAPSGRIVLRVVLGAALKRVERGPDGLPLRLYPYTRSRLDDAPATVVIDPELADGRPVVRGTHLATGALAARFKAGRSLDELAREHGREPAEIEEAIRYELRPAR